ALPTELTALDQRWSVAHRRTGPEESDRVDRLPMVSQLEVEMRARTPAGAAGDPDRVAARDQAPGACDRPRQMRIHGGEAAPNVEQDDVAVALVTDDRADRRDAARRRGAHGQALQRPDVDPGMEATGARPERRADDPVSGPEKAEPGAIRDARGRARRQDEHGHEESPGHPHGGESLQLRSEDLGTVGRARRPE